MDVKIDNSYDPQDEEDNWDYDPRKSDRSPLTKDELLFLAYYAMAAIAIHTGERALPKDLRTAIAMANDWANEIPDMNVLGNKAMRKAINIAMAMEPSEASAADAYELSTDERMAVGLAGASDLKLAELLPDDINEFFRDNYQEWADKFPDGQPFVDFITASLRKVLGIPAVDTQS